MNIVRTGRKAKPTTNVDRLCALCVILIMQASYVNSVCLCISCAHILVMAFVSPQRLSLITFA